MEKITTMDGSETFYNEQYDDIYHSRTGAVEEAFEKFVKPAMIAGLAETGSVKILDVCFGLGYNSCAAIDAILDVDPGCEILIIGLENDEKILEKTAVLSPPFKNYGMIRELVKDRRFKNDNIDIRLLFGDAKKTIITIQEVFDAVFLDPFSPSKHPDLWQAGFLKEIYNKMRRGAILSTYSCAKAVREDLKKAGFRVMDGPRVGRKSPSTIALRP